MKFTKINNVQIADVVNQPVYDIELEKNHYFSANNFITHNCRLRNKIDKPEFSFTNGMTGIRTGSCNVITLNLSRITQDWSKKTLADSPVDISGMTFTDIKNSVECQKHLATKVYDENDGLAAYITDIVERVHKYHIAYKQMLYDFEEAGMLTPSNAGYIKMSDLFSTVGVNGFNEAARFLGMTVNYNDDYKKFCRLITGTISELNQKNTTKKFRFNTEFVPAEGLSSKNYNWDKADGYWVPEDKNLYNSYFYDAHDPNTSILDKFRLHGAEFTELLDGGVGLHLNLDEHPTKEAAYKMMNFAKEVGCNYWTINVPNTKCNNCGFIAKAPFEKCPKCQSIDTEQFTRVVGFLRPVSSFDIYRLKEAQKRVYSHVNNAI